MKTLTIKPETRGDVPAGQMENLLRYGGERWAFGLRPAAWGLALVSLGASLFTYFLLNLL